MSLINPIKLCIKHWQVQINHVRLVRGSRLPPQTPVDDKDLLTKTGKTENVEELLKNSAISSEAKVRDRDSMRTSSTYPKVRNLKMEQASKAVRPSVDPKETTILLFPGQGTQFVGMGKKLLEYPNVKEMYAVASTILGYDLLQLCLEGPIEKLNRTAYCQPAVLVTSLAAVERLRYIKPSAIENCYSTTGFSVGEITSLVFAGAITFEDAVELIRVRGEAMQLASELVQSGMCTVFLHPDAKIKYGCSVASQWCKKHGELSSVCQIANYLYPSCKVIAGSEEALKFLEKHSSDFGIRRMKRLPVSGAFHTELMKPALEPFTEALKKITISSPRISVHSNADGKRLRNAEAVARGLRRQIYSPVKWEQTMHIMYERDEGVNFPMTFECGPGYSLKTLLKFINKKAWDSCVSIDT